MNNKQIERLHKKANEVVSKSEDIKKNQMEILELKNTIT